LAPAGTIAHTQEGSWTPSPTRPNRATDATASDAVSPHLVTFNRGIDRLGIPPAAQG